MTDTIELQPGETRRWIVAAPAPLRASGVTFECALAKGVQVHKFSVRDLPINLGVSGVSLDYFTPEPRGIFFGRVLDLPEGATVEMLLENRNAEPATVAMRVWMRVQPAKEA